MISSNKIIYIFCPANLASGGPDALHQLRYYMDKVNLNAYLVYFNIAYGVNPIPERYKIYEPKIKNIEEIEDVKSNVLIVPESSTILLNNYSKIKKCIWWLSVNHYDNPPQKKIRIIKNLIKVLLGMKEKETKRFQFSIHDCLNLCASKYTFEFLKKQRVKGIKYLVEPISKVFLDYNNQSNFQRDNIVLYNPSKPSAIMDKLLERNDFEFKPIIGYNTHQLIDIYCKAKLYVDFGHFGGPERIPKEAVYFGCGILVGKRNAAKNNFDVAILPKYKIRKYNDLDVVSSKIDYMLQNYDLIIGDFIPFKRKIQLMEDDFLKEIIEIFCS